ncbi:transcriptional regulator [Actinocatenispora thailandica]|uniref:Transcriptional regulator n=1 Tax=Actinocatenispora thailandica TaxID=227318 RepID=A0A7R7DSH7_9ACTN|nr:transcriptional regulator [Actinocatenispora thailandica]
MLEAVGLRPSEWRAYHVLMRLPTGTAEELAERLGLDIDEVAAALAVLQRRKAVTRTPDDPRRFRAVPPDLAFGPELRRRQRDLAVVEEAVDRLSTEYRNQLALRGAGELIEVVFGEAIGPRIVELERKAQKEVCGIMKSPTFAMRPSENVAEMEGLRAGIAYRSIYPREVLTIPGDPFELVKSVRHGEQARVIDETPLKMIMVDRAVAVVPVLPADSPEPSALLVYPSGLLDALVALFEAIWENATPLLATDDAVEPAGENAPSAQDLHLLSLLLAGLTDQAIAAQLGLSMRTVQRRVHGLIELAGVRTRLQLIWRAAHRNWL